MLKMIFTSRLLELPCGLNVTFSEYVYKDDTIHLYQENNTGYGNVFTTHSRIEDPYVCWPYQRRLIRRYNKKQK